MSVTGPGRRRVRLAGAAFAVAVPTPPLGAPLATSLAAALLATLMLAAAAQGATLRVCVDRSSAGAARDQDMAARVARQAGLQLAVHAFDGSGGDDGFPLRRFGQLLATDCDLVMGYPIDATGGAPPPGLLATRPYAQTGFVLVVPHGSAARSLADLPPGAMVAITAETAPALSVAEHPGLQADSHASDAETLQAVAGATVQAAAVWQPTVVQYQSRPDAVRLDAYPLAGPHARYDVVALYLPGAARQAKLFDATQIALHTGDEVGAAPAGLPALYTAAQASAGFGLFVGNCAMCHGAHLEGRGAPALRGPNWANARADYTVGEVFTVVSQQMPATDPGSLGKADYTAIMAYLLQQNGYPAGPTPLDFDAAAGSTQKLLWHGGS